MTPWRTTPSETHRESELDHAVMQRDRLARARQIMLTRLQKEGVKIGQGFGKDGRPLRWILDCREVLMHAECLAATGVLFWQTIKETNATHVGGVSLSGDLLTCSVLNASSLDGTGLKGFSVRHERKSYGLRRLVEGAPIARGARIVVVDDLLNSGATFKHALKALAEHNVQVVAACVLVNFEKSGEQFLRRLGIPLYFAFTLREIKPKQTKTRF